MLNFVLNEHFVELVGHLAWPVTTIILLLLTRELITQIATAIADRIKDIRSNVSLGPGGINIGRVADDAVSGLTETGKKLSDRLKIDPSFETQLSDWLGTKNAVLSPTALINGTKDEDLRKEAVQYFQL